MFIKSTYCSYYMLSYKAGFVYLTGFWGSADLSFWDGFSLKPVLMTDLGFKFRF